MKLTYQGLMRGRPLKSLDNSVDGDVEKERGPADCLRIYSTVQFFATLLMCAMSVRGDGVQVPVLTV